MHAMLQQPEPSDYVIATGESHSVYEFVVEVLNCLDLLPAGRNVDDVVNEYVEVDPKLFRTGEIHDLRGDASLANRELNWAPKVDFKGLVRMMVESDAALEIRGPEVELVRGAGSLPIDPKWGHDLRPWYAGTTIARS